MPQTGDKVGPYHLTALLGKGGFGMVFEADDATDQNKTVAIKVEDVSKTRRPQLHYEYRVYRSIHKSISAVRKNRIPLVYGFLKNVGSSKYQGLVMERLGANIQQIFDSYKTSGSPKQFSNAEVFMVADQALDCLHALHSVGFIHRDVKPDNFCVRYENSNRLCIVDFGLSKRYCNSDNEHIPHRKGKGLIGTTRYTSIRCHEGHEQSRRDDLESFMYMVLYLLRPRLPWQGTRHSDKKTKYAMILKKKLKAVKTGSLFESLPTGFKPLFAQIRGLAFTEKPPYQSIKATLSQMLV